MEYTTNKVSHKFARAFLPEMLRDPYRNAIIIADIMQLYQWCEFEAAFDGDRLAGLVSYYEDMQFKAAGYYCPDPNCLPRLFHSRSLSHPGAESYYGLIDAGLKDFFESQGLIEQCSMEHRMRYVPGSIRLKGIPEKIKIVKLGEENLGEISRLYSIVPAIAWTPKALVYGPHYGAFDGSTLVSIAGVHFNTKYVAEIGNVVTMPMYQGRGLARAVTQAVVNELMRTSKIIFLCVLSDNMPAIHLYLDMGFVITDNAYLCKFSLAPHSIEQPI